MKTVVEWLNNWTGVGHVVTVMARQDNDLELTRFDGRGRRATFFVTGMEHSLTNATVSAFESTPWRAVQLAAWNALGKTSGETHPPPPAADIILP